MHPAMKGPGGVFFIGKILNVWLVPEFENMCTASWLFSKFTACSKWPITPVTGAKEQFGLPRTCADPESLTTFFCFCFFLCVFSVDEWIQIPLISGHHRPASETPFKWRFAGVPLMTHY